MDEYNQKRLQKIVGKFLYYAIAIDPAMLMALNALAAFQTNPKIEIAKQITQFLDFSATHPDRITEYRKCGLNIGTGVTKQIQWVFFSRPKLKNTNSIDAPGKWTSACKCSIMKNVMASATKAVLGRLFEKYHKATSTRTSLADIVHIQPPTPVETDNIAANIIFNGTAKQKIPRAIYMRFYWVRDRIRQNDFQVFWEEEKKTWQTISQNTTRYGTIEQ